MKLPIINGQIALTSDADGVSDVFLGSLRIENGAAPKIRATTSIGTYGANGLAFDATGRLSYVDATAGLPVGATYASGLPVSSAGAVCVSSDAAAYWSNGVPFAANGAVSASFAPSATLRFASSQNRRAQKKSVATATQRKMWGRYKVIIGSDNFTSLRLLFQGTYQDASGDVNLGNDVAIEACAFEKETGGAAYTQVFFGGSLTGTVPNGTSEYLSDPILPSAFGLAKFTRGEVYWIRVLCSVDATGKGFPVANFSASSATGGSSLRYNPATCAFGAVYGTGNSVYTNPGGGGPTDYNFDGAFNPLVIGTPEGTAGKYVVGIGDSIVQERDDTAPGGAGWYKGFFMRSLVNSDFTTNPIAGCNFGFSGTSASMWAVNPRTHSEYLLKYANVGVEEFGTNLADYSGSATIWALLKGKGYKVIRTKLLTTTTSTDGWATTVNQTKVAAWTSPSGNRIVFNNDVAAQAGTLYDTFVDFDVDVLGTDRDLWKAPGYTADGIHPTSLAHELMAVRMRTAIAALP